MWSGQISDFFFRKQTSLLEVILEFFIICLNDPNMRLTYTLAATINSRSYSVARNQFVCLMFKMLIIFNLVHLCVQGLQ